MKPAPLGQIRQIVDGRAIGDWAQSPVEIRSIATDTRHLGAGALFVAIKGDNHDGHDYLAAAAKAGAAAAIVERTVPGAPEGFRLVQVPNTRAALGKLARHFRQHLKGKVVAVGGSNGKTGTKNLIDSVLSARLRGSISPKSFNNDIGVPLAVFDARADQDYLVLELGTNHHGEIRTLTHIAQPDIAVITNCAAEHLEGLGDLDGVRREEASIIEGLRADGLLIVNGDDGELLELVRAFPNRLTFGLRDCNDLYAEDARCDLAGVRFRLNRRREVRIPLLGEHVAVNSLAAIAVGRELGMSENEIVNALSTARGPEMRLQLQKAGGVMILNDAYNANPASMKAALRTMAKLPASGRRIAVLGNMRELGQASDELHREIGSYIPGCGLDLLVCVGESAALIAEEAVKAGFSAARTALFPDAAAAAKSLPQRVGEGDLLLLKASRLMKLETIATALGSGSGAKSAN